jgi:acetyltransferase-like isoleucine patch superfamily enzyme
MQTELDKCMNGDWYDCHDPVFIELKANARRLLTRYNSLSYNDTTDRDKLLKELFANVGSNVSVGNPFLCDYGRNIHIGNNVSVNINCTFVDCNKITSATMS